MRRATATAGSLLAAGLACGGGAGTGEFSGVVTFTNLTVDEIQVERVQGFEHEPPCGRLMPGGLAQAEMPPMEFPTEIRLRWHPAGQPDRMQLTSLNLTNLRPAPGQALELVFADEGWRAELRD